MAGCVAAAGLTVWQGKLAERAVTEAAAVQTGRLVFAAIAVLAFLATLVLDAGRAWFAAQPSRRSAFFALGAGAKLIARRPLQALNIGLVTALATLLLPALVMVLRQRVTQGSGGTVAFAFLLAQLAVALAGYGHAARLIGLTELARADLADRARKAAFEMAPPRTSPPPPEAPLSPLATISPVSAVSSPAPTAAESGPAFAEPPTTDTAPAPAISQVEQEAALGPVGLAPEVGAGGGTGGGA